LKWAITFLNYNSRSQKTSQHKLYTDLAWLYDKIYPRIFDYRELFESIEGFLDTHQCRSILDVACGTGRLMAILEKEGYDVTGLDLSQEMLDIAKTRCKGKLLRQDMREMHVDRTFDALLCLGRSFGYMLTDDDASRALEGFCKALRDGGILVLDSFDAEITRRYQFGDWREAVYEFEDMKITRRSKSSDYNKADITWFVEWEYIIENGGKHVVLDQTRLRSYDKEYLQETLLDMGLEIIQLIQGRELTLAARKVGKTQEEC
jgi:SAM-dependent methyltransferase